MANNCTGVTNTLDLLILFHKQYESETYVKHYEPIAFMLMTSYKTWKRANQKFIDLRLNDQMVGNEIYLVIFYEKSALFFVALTEI